jgi:hypothetical protein
MKRTVGGVPVWKSQYLVMAGLSAAKLPAIHYLNIDDEAHWTITAVMDGRYGLRPDRP